VLVPLDVGETIFVTYGSGPGATIDTGGMGTLVLLDSVPAGTAEDLDPVDEIASRPADVIHVLEFQLSTRAPFIEASDTIHTILAPDGVGPAQRLHVSSLLLEQFLGTAVPEPGSLAPAPIIGFFLRRPRRSALADHVPIHVDGAKERPALRRHLRQQFRVGLPFVPSAADHVVGKEDGQAPHSLVGPDGGGVRDGFGKEKDRSGGTTVGVPER